MDASYSKLLQRVMFFVSYWHEFISSPSVSSLAKMHRREPPSAVSLLWIDGYNIKYHLQFTAIKIYNS